MRHFPVFIDLRGKRVSLAGSGQAAIAKLRLLLKTEAHIAVYAPSPQGQISRWADDKRIILHERPLRYEDVVGALLVYAATDDPDEDARIAALGSGAGALVNVVDNLEASDFITPAIVDRDPVTVAIGTEGAAPVLARQIKAENEERLSGDLGTFARAGRAFRERAEALPQGRKRREFWARFYGDTGPETLLKHGAYALPAALETLLQDALSEAAPQSGSVALIGAGPGDPELLTLKARRLLHDADIVIHDRLVTADILELARREATVIEVGKSPRGPSWKQDDINALMIQHAKRGAKIARLKSGDPTVFGRLDEEVNALDTAGITCEIVPGITAASAAAASMRASLTRRGRNKSFSLMTGHDMKGLAEHDWRGLARPGAAAAIYMGVGAARFIQGRLLMHGADTETPVTAVENASRTEQRTVSTTLAALNNDLRENQIDGPAILLLGLSPHRAVSPDALPNTSEQTGIVSDGQALQAKNHQRERSV